MKHTTYGRQSILSAFPLCIISKPISVKYLHSTYLFVALLLAFLSTTHCFAQALVRIKDIAKFSENRDYQLIGYGLITGLNGTGDKAAMSLEMIHGMLQNMGMEIDKATIQTRNCAAVVVTSMLSSFGRPGDSLDVTVSSIGDAKSLQGGVLLPVLLKGGDGQVYAVAQGQLSIGGFEEQTTGGAGGASAQKNHLTVARIPKGAIQERASGDEFGRNGKLTLLISHKDSSLSRKVKQAIDRQYGDEWARVANPGTVEITIPSSFKNDPVGFASVIEDLTLSVEEPNRVVINERTGTVIVGNRVRISRVVISQGALRIEVQDARQARPQPGRKSDSKGSMIQINGETTVDDLVKALNAVGATQKDLISIFQAIDAAGALHGELKIM